MSLDLLCCDTPNKCAGSGALNVSLISYTVSGRCLPARCDRSSDFRDTSQYRSQQKWNANKFL